MNISSIASAYSSLPGMMGSEQPPTSSNASPVEQRKAAATQFEAILLRQFLNQSVGSMMGGSDDGSSAGGAQDTQGSIYGYMLTDMMATQMAKGGGLGLSKVIEQQLEPHGDSAGAGATAKGVS